MSGKIGPHQVRQIEQAASKKTHLLGRCRALMTSGVFRPNSTEIAGKGAEHDISNRFGGVSTLYEQALDEETVDGIVRRIVNGDNAPIGASARTRIALAAVFGRLVT